MTVKTFKEHRQNCTKYPVASFIDIAALYPLIPTTIVFLIGGMIIMPHNSLEGTAALATGALAGATSGYAVNSSAYGFKETTKCRRELEKLDLN